MTLPISSAPTNGAWPVRNVMSPPSIGAGGDHLGVARPEDALRGDDLDLECHERVLLPCGLAQLGGLGLGRLGATDVQERLLGQVVEVAVDEGLEATRRSPRPGW